MSFSEKTKLEAKKKSNFKCCVCQSPFVDVCAIVSFNENGKDEVENAVPVCGACEQIYTIDPDLRNRLRQLRDHWWTVCRDQSSDGSVFEKTDALGNRLDDVKKMLVPFIEAQLKEIKEANSIDRMSAYFTAITSGMVVPLPRRCPRCGKPMRFHPEKNSYVCEKCRH